MEKIIAIDLGDEESINAIAEAEKLERMPKEMTVFLPLPCFGKSNSHLDLRDDLLYAAFSAEQLAAHAISAHAAFSFSNPDYLERIRLTLLNPSQTILGPLREAFIIFNPDVDGTTTKFEDEHSELWNRISEFEEHIDSFSPLVPEVADWYFAELLGSYWEMESEAPDYFQQEISRHPERRLHFLKSAHSGRLGAPCYTSQDGWLIPSSLDLDKFFGITGQRFLSSEFETGSITLIENTALAITKNQVVYFPLSQYFKSRFVASLVDSDPYSEMERFNWTNATFTHSAYDEHIRSLFPDAFKKDSPHRVDCLVHQSGDLMCVGDGAHLHILYDTKPLNVHQIKSVLAAASNLAVEISNLAGLTSNIICDWTKLDDERFEALCYDILYAHPKFDNETIRKMGKSRSRDGGRDIIIYERSKGSDKPKKWIFQCKLITDGSSLTARKLQDVGDMLDQYEAEGFGVMTSAVIDATLYDKLEKICKKRSVEERHYSVYELERTVVRYPNIKLRYFDI